MQDVVQIYCQNHGSSFAPLHSRLCGFKRVFVPVGESLRMTIAIDRSAFRVVKMEGEWINEGPVELFVGVDQPDERTTEITGHSALSIRI